jgi:hypothetical protein
VVAVVAAVAAAAAVAVAVAVDSLPLVNAARTAAMAKTAKKERTARFTLVEFGTLQLVIPVTPAIPARAADSAIRELLARTAKTDHPALMGHPVAERLCCEPGLTADPFRLKTELLTPLEIQMAPLPAAAVVPVARSF